MIQVFLFLLLWWIVWLVPVRIKYRRSYYAIMTFLLLYLGIATMGIYYDNVYPWHMMHKESIIRMGPDATYGVINTAHNDDKVRLIGSCGDWRKIKNATVSGWVSADCLEIVR